MNIRDLKYLVAVADTGSFSRASEKCFVSQPALSMQVKKLEESIDTKLFDRDTTGLSVTTKGEVLVEQARKILDEVNQFYAMAREEENPLAGEITLGAFPTISPYLVPRVLPVLMARYASLNFSVVEDKTAELLKKLQDGSIDVALIALPVNEKGITGVKVMEENFYLCVSRHSHLYDYKSVNYDDLENENIMLLEEGHCLREQALSVCQQANASNTKLHKSASLETLIGMVANGLGVTLVPEMATGVRQDGVKFLPFNVNEPSRSVALCWKESSERGALFRRLAHSLLSLQL